MFSRRAASRREALAIVLGTLATSLSLTGCGEDLSKANPKPEEKRAKYLDLHPPEPDPKAAPKGVRRGASPRR